MKVPGIPQNLRLPMRQQYAAVNRREFSWLETLTAESVQIEFCNFHTVGMGAHLLLM